MYLLKLALRPWRIAPFSQLLSSIAVGCLLFLSGVLAWLHDGLRPVIARLQSEQVITAYLDSSVDAAEGEAKIMDAIRERLAAAGNGSAPLDVRREDGRGFADKISGIYPELSKELRDLGEEVNQVVPRSISVTGVLSADSLERLKTIPGIEAVESSKDRYSHVVGAFKTLRWVSRLLLLGVGFALALGLLHLSRMNASIFGDALSWMRLSGGAAWTLRVPGLIIGLWVGAMGGAIACTTWVSVGRWMAEQIRSFSPILEGMPVASVSTGGVLLAVGLLLGALAGALVSGGEAVVSRRWFAVGRSPSAPSPVAGTQRRVAELSGG
jgi:cell division protein FtsX